MNLKSLREKAGLSQQDVANRSGLPDSPSSLTQKQVSRIELDPLNQNLEAVLTYLRVVAPDKKSEFIEYCEKQLVTQSTLNNQLIKKKGFSMKKNELRKLLESSIQNLKNSDNPFIQKLNLVDYLSELNSNLQDIFAKPILSAMGHSDAGKSTILNYILGKRILPAKWQPATCLVTLLMHQTDKPAYLQDSHHVYVMKTGFKPNMVFDPSFFQQYLIDAGGADLLTKYGARDDDGEILNRDAYMVIVFEDIEILKSVWILDTPGALIEPKQYQEQDGASDADLSDREKANSAIHLVDGLIFASSCISFMRNEDPEFLQSILSHNLPINPQEPLLNIMILKTHSYGQITKEQTQEVFYQSSINLNKCFTGAGSLYEHWSQHVQGLKPLRAEDWSGRMSPFFLENAEYCANFDVNLKALITFITENRELQIEKKTLGVLAKLKGALQSKIEELQNDGRSREEKKSQLDAEVAKFATAREKLLREFEALKQSTEDYKKDNLEQVSEFYRGFSSEDGILRFINDKYSDDQKDEAKSSIGKAVSNHIQNKLTAIITRSTKEFNLSTQVLVDRWQKAVPTNRAANINGLSEAAETGPLSFGDFDAQSAFVGGLAGLASFGAMAGYVATITSNLGAYILVGKAAGVLTALGITSSVTTLPALVAATGGPIVWGIAIAAAIGYAAYRLFGNWRKALAKSVSQGLEEKSVLSTLKKGVEKYWNDTKFSLGKCIDALAQETEAHIKSMFEDANKEYGTEVLSQAEQILKNELKKYEGTQLGFASL